MNIAGLRLERGGNLLDGEAGGAGALEQGADRGLQGTPGPGLGFRRPPGFAPRLAPGRGGRSGRSGRFTRLETGQFSVELSDLGQERFLLFNQRDDPFEVRRGDLSQVHVAEA